MSANDRFYSSLPSLCKQYKNTVKTIKRYEYDHSLLESESMVHLEYSWVCSLVDVIVKGDRVFVTLSWVL